MRRGFSIVLILLFGLGPLSAMIDGSEDAGLPLCCRRHGMHHCAAMASVMTESADPQVAFTVPQTCPYYPGPTLAVLTPSHALSVVPASFLAMQPSGMVAVSEQAAAYSVLNHTHAGRGPPIAKCS